MVPNDDFDGKTTYLNCFNIHMIFEQKYPKPAIVVCTVRIIGTLEQGVYLLKKRLY